MKIFWKYENYLRTIIACQCGQSSSELIQVGIFGAAHGWGRRTKRPLFLNSVTYILQWWNLAQLFLSYRRCKNMWIAWHTPCYLLTLSFFHQKLATFVMLSKTYRFRFNAECLVPLTFFTLYRIFWYTWL